MTIKKKYQKQKRFFERSGFVDPAVSYHVPLEDVTNKDAQDIKTMVDLGRFFSIFAPRQSGKTTFFRDVCRELEKNPTYIAILLSFEDYSKLDIPGFYQCFFQEFQTQLIERLTAVNCQQIDKVKSFLDSYVLINHISFRNLFEGLNQIIQFKKIVIFIDEFDGTPLDELSNFLTALRKLYQKYKPNSNKALYSVALVGIKNITKLVVEGISPFNIADEVHLPPFSIKNIRELYSQYTEETNQPFTEEAVKSVYQSTCGQPWLVNRLGTILTVNIKKEIISPITPEDVEQAIHILLKEKNKHFDNLLQKISFYKKVWENVILHEVDYDPDDKSQSWLEQYGLIKEKENKAVVANPIYQKRFFKGPTSQKISQENEIEKGNVFISYSHKDKKWLEKVQTHLKVLEVEGIDFHLWDDNRIKAGLKWREEIEVALQTAKVAILLVSTDFLASDFIRNKELPPLLEAVEKKGAVVLPLILKPCRFSSHPHLSQFQAINDPQKPLSKLSEDEQDEILLALMDRIAGLV